MVLERYDLVASQKTVGRLRGCQDAGQRGVIENPILRNVVQEDERSARHHQRGKPLSILAGTSAHRHGLAGAAGGNYGNQVRQSSFATSW